MAGARALWRATGIKDGDFGKPIIAVVNSFTQFVPGHVHLKDMGQLVAREIEKAGGVAKEFNTIAVDDGIAMGHDGMLYSLPSRDIIADSVEYMVNAHCADAIVCISNCDKITPGMLMASMRLNIPVVFVSGGPMEAGKTKLAEHKRDLVDAIVIGSDPTASDEKVGEYERSACPTCRSTCASTRCRRSSSRCSAPPAPRSPSTRPATSARATARRPDSSASNTTRSLPRWRWCSSPTTPRRTPTRSCGSTTTRRCGRGWPRAAALSSRARSSSRRCSVNATP